jgi:glycosyltransferase involved in cell wall biosynthesis
LEETAAFLKANGIALRLAAPPLKWRSRFNRARAIMKTALILRKVLFDLRPDVVWFFGHWSSVVMLVAGACKNSVMVYTAPELLSELPLARFCQMFVMRRVQYVIVPEENRMWLLKLSSRTTAKTLVVPNRPLEDVATIATSNKTDTRAIFIQNGGDEKCTKFFIYQGYFDEARCLGTISRAFLRMERREFGLILLGEYDRIVDPLRLNQYMASGRIVHIPKIAPPLHLSLSSGCHAGIMLYSPESLNNIYCAPNKLFEYPMLGLPILMPRYPGLQALNDRFEFGVYCDTSNDDSVLDAMHALADHDSSFWQARLRHFLAAMPTSEELYADVCQQLACEVSLRCS